MKKQGENNDLVLYQTKQGAIEFHGDFLADTIWTTQAQLSEVFNVDVRTINEHIKNIFKTGELEENRTIRKFRIVRNEGRCTITREVNQYDFNNIKV